MILADYQHPLVREKAEALTKGCFTLKEKIAAIFYYVRDDIKFGFPLDADLVKASDTIQLGYGQCNTKGALFLALCKALNILARLHFSLIKKEIQKGLFTGIAYWLLPKNLSHSWIELKINNQWIKIDTYINDEAFYCGGIEVLHNKGWDTGYSVSCAKTIPSIDLDFVEEQSVQMDAVVEDHGTYNEPMDYYQSKLYKNRPGWFKKIAYRLWIKSINRKIDKLRKKML